jgi:glutathione S-transferase
MSAENFILVIGSKNTSSWSLRPWLLMRQAKIPFREVKIPLGTDTTEQEILRYSPSGKVPVLIEGKIKVWESLAICEYLAERFPSLNLWPEDAEARAMARSISHEMHAGFLDLRKNMPVNCSARFARKPVAREVQEDIRRVLTLWNECRMRYASAGDFLFGDFSIADAMYAPVVTRFVTYDLEVDSLSRSYMDTVLNLMPMKEWLAAAEREEV